MTLSVGNDHTAALPSSVPSVLFTQVGSFGRILHLLTKLGYSIGFIIAALLGVLWYFQERLLFHPHSPQGLETPDKNPKPFQNPSQMGMPYEDVTLTTCDGVKLHGWLIKQRDDSQHVATILFFQGNAGNMGLRLPNIQRLYQHCNVNIFVLSYRGYGHSAGIPSEQGVYRDAEAALDFLLTRQDIDHSKVFIFGRSIGGAVAIDLVSKHSEKVCGIIAENTFTSLEDMAVIVFPFLKIFASLVTLAQRVFMDSLRKVPAIPVPILYISGLQDALVPPAHVASLYNASVGSSLRRLYTVSNGTHNGTWQEGGSEYYKEILQFLRDAVAAPSASNKKAYSSSVCTVPKPRQRQVDLVAETATNVLNSESSL